MVLCHFLFANFSIFLPSFDDLEVIILVFSFFWGSYDFSPRVCMHFRIFFLGLAFIFLHFRTLKLFKIAAMSNARKKVAQQDIKIKFPPAKVSHKKKYFVNRMSVQAFSLMFPKISKIFNCSNLNDDLNFFSQTKVTPMCFF